MDAAVATGYDPLLDTEPALARTMAASVKQRIAFGERAGQKVRRIGSGFGDEGERPALTGPRCISVNGFSLHANTEIPAHRRNQLERLMRSTARGAVSLERLAQDAEQLAVDEQDRVLVWTGSTGSVPVSESTASTSFVATQSSPPLTYTPVHLTEKILAVRSAIEGECK